MIVKWRLERLWKIELQSHPFGSKEILFSHLWWDCIGSLLAPDRTCHSYCCVWEVTPSLSHTLIVPVTYLLTLLDPNKIRNVELLLANKLCDIATRYVFGFPLRRITADAVCVCLIQVFVLVGVAYGAWVVTADQTFELSWLENVWSVWAVLLQHSTTSKCFPFRAGWTYGSNI